MTPSKQEHSTTRIKRLMPKVTNRRCTESVLKIRKMQKEKGSAKTQQHKNEGKKLVGANLVNEVTCKPKRTKKVAKRKMASRWKQAKKPLEGDIYSDDEESDTSSADSQQSEVHDKRRRKDDLNFDTALVWERSKRDGLRRKNIQGFGNIKKVGWQLSKKCMFTRDDNAFFRSSLIVKHSTRLGYTQKKSYNRDSMGADFVDYID